MDDYINRYNLDVDLRFDIMAYVYRERQWEETHIENAFILSHNVLFITINFICIFEKFHNNETIAAVVEHYIKSKPYLSTAMAQGSSF